MRIQSRLAYSFAIGVLSLGAIERAYAQQSGLVNVNLGDVVIQEIAEDINVAVGNIPVTVQVPVGVAANVCGISVDVLATDLQGDNTAECNAQNTSQALNQIVQRSVTNQR